jgi:Zn-dependent protease
MDSILVIVFQLAILIISVVIHEVSHGYMAYALGDPTAKYAGRLTLNPLNHVDPMGSILVPLITSMFGFTFGWAKPVPYNPYNLSNQKWGPGLVGFAGPMANIIIAIVFGLVIRFGSSLPVAYAMPVLEIATLIVILNLGLTIFNLLPIPPLDGSKVLFTFLPYSLYPVQEFLERNGFMLLLILILLLNTLSTDVIFPAVSFLFQLITGQSLFSLFM